MRGVSRCSATPNSTNVYSAGASSAPVSRSSNDLKGKSHRGRAPARRERGPWSRTRPCPSAGPSGTLRHHGAVAASEAPSPERPTPAVRGPNRPDRPINSERLGGEQGHEDGSPVDGGDAGGHEVDEGEAERDELGEVCDPVEQSLFVVGARADRVEVRVDRDLLDTIEGRRELGPVPGGQLRFDAEDPPVVAADPR